MEPIFGFALYFVATGIVAVVASKRGRSGMVYFFSCLIGGVVLAMLIGQVSGGMAAGFGAFLVPVAGLITALSSKTSADLAVEKGTFGDFRKCPFCAESVRKEAIKCKHCSSDLPAMTATELAAVKGPKRLAAGDMECHACHKHIPISAVRCAYCGITTTPLI